MQVKNKTGFNWSCNRKRPQKTSLLRFGPVFCSFSNWEDRLRLRSKALGAKRPDRTGLSNTNIYVKDTDGINRALGYGCRRDSVSFSYGCSTKVLDVERRQKHACREEQNSRW